MLMKLIKLKVYIGLPVLILHELAHFLVGMLMLKVPTKLEYNTTTLENIFAISILFEYKFKNTKVDVVRSIIIGLAPIVPCLFIFLTLFWGLQTQYFFVYGILLMYFSYYLDVLTPSTIDVQTINNSLTDLKTMKDKEVKTEDTDDNNG